MNERNCAIDTPDVQPWRPVPRRQVLQLICTQKGPVTALLGPKGPRCLPDPAAQRSSRFSAGDQHPAGPAAGAEPHLDQVFTAGHDGAIRVWETRRLGVLSRRLVACATLVQVWQPLLKRRADRSCPAHQTMRSANGLSSCARVLRSALE